MRKNKGFTLVEILIVVVILGILAAIVIPQFSDASTQSKVSSSQTTLASLRSQIQLYKIQHNDQPPSVTTLVQATWIAQMTGQTDATGAAGTDFGPYIQQVPINPWNGLQTITADNTGAWVYDAATGDVWVGTTGAVQDVIDDLEASGDAYVAGP